MLEVEVEAELTLTLPESEPETETDDECEEEDAMSGAIVHMLRRGSSDEMLGECCWTRRRAQRHHRHSKSTA
ncbi:hypothetical protein BCR44DRAFT_1444381 [Catenaria anguillulae PL171]|uniref:Uncharacterized protein n=1 Tax=Catenaria anguillulae PL171 TaxID=765915 RepID=A0A1Y2H7K4_9FUNG|nr:hypothetical protein BCR44DRAFT_1444381 [Catenaria anguillulae PL171]